MNRYHESMEHCAPRRSWRKQLREAVCPRSRNLRPDRRLPPGIFPESAAGCGADRHPYGWSPPGGSLISANWDAIFASRFGEWAASTPMGQASLSGRCVSPLSATSDPLTVRLALVSKKPSPGAGLSTAGYGGPGRRCSDKANQSDDDFIYPPEIGYYLTRDFSWADFKAADLKGVGSLDWSDFTSYGITSLALGNTLQPYCLSNFFRRQLRRGSQPGLRPGKPTPSPTLQHHGQGRRLGLHRLAP